MRRSGCVRRTTRSASTMRRLAARAPMRLWVRGTSVSWVPSAKVGRGEYGLPRLHRSERMQSRTADLMEFANAMAFSR